jgi:hypothetical protein
MRLSEWNVEIWGVYTGTGQGGVNDSTPDIVKRENQDFIL